MWRQARGTEVPPTGAAGLVPRGAVCLPDHCLACRARHRVPGLVRGPVDEGPSLGGMARRTCITGVLPNTPDNLAAWIRDPQCNKPGSAMPALGVGAADAQAMAASLGRLH